MPNVQCFNCPGCGEVVVPNTIHKCDSDKVEFDRLMSGFDFSDIEKEFDDM